jgi:hypothetical protein
MFSTVARLSAGGSKNRGFIAVSVKSFVSSPKSLEYTRPSDQWKWDSLYSELKWPEPEADFSPPLVAENKKSVITSSLRGVERAITCASTHASYTSHMSLYFICAHV